ncbi:MAG: molybdopterin adenylyltransferase [Bacteroidetes bacterium]|nr:molybdopterin adenylyltransferase [Bacteroidota bacterium]
MAAYKIGILVTSDRASHKVYEDISGKTIENFLNNAIEDKWNACYEIVPDEQSTIESKLKKMAEECCLVFTTGGTGPAKRDVTVEVTEYVCQKLLPGFGELMRSASLKSVPTAILSRQTAGILNKCLVVNLPGKPAAIEDCLSVVFPAIPYCIDLIEGPYITTNENEIKAFRPKQ